MTPSAALVQFRRSLQLAQQLMQIEATTYIDPPQLADQPAVEGLRGGAAVLMVAAFENFLRTHLEEHVSALAEKDYGATLAILPERMRVHSVYATLELAMKGPPGDRPKRDRLADIESACARVVSRTVNPKCFGDTGSNPSPKTVKDMFKNLGVRDVFTTIRSDFENRWGSQVASTFIADKLLEIVNRRHVVAHTADALSISRASLAEATRFLRILAESLDEFCSRHVSGFAGSVPQSFGI